jgi:hypothetical protein
MKLRLFTVMKIVAVAGIVLGVYVHIERLVEDEDDFAFSILKLEAAVLAVALVIALGIRRFARVVQRDYEYAGSLWRSDSLTSVTQRTCAIESADDDDRCVRHGLLCGGD